MCASCVAQEPKRNTISARVIFPQGPYRNNSRDSSSEGIVLARPPARLTSHPKGDDKASQTSFVIVPLYAVLAATLPARVHLQGLVAHLEEALAGVVAEPRSLNHGCLPITQIVRQMLTRLACVFFFGGKVAGEEGRDGLAVLNI